MVVTRVFAAAVAVALVLPGAAGAQAPAGPPPSPSIAAAPSMDEVRWPRPARPRGIPTSLAAEAALAAVEACAAAGYKVNALVTDTGAIPIALLSGDGAAAITQRIAMTKARIVLKYRASSGEVTDRAAKDPKLTMELAADPLILMPRAGAFPIKAGDEVVGAIAVSGAPGGEKDEPCAQAGIAKIQARLK